MSTLESICTGVNSLQYSTLTYPTEFLHLGLEQFCSFHLTSTFDILRLLVSVLFLQGSRSSPQEIINCIIIDLYPESTDLFVVVIIAMCLGPLWSLDVTEPVSTEYLGTENFANVNFLMGTRTAQKSLSSLVGCPDCFHQCHERQTLQAGFSLQSSVLSLKCGTEKFG